MVHLVYETHSLTVDNERGVATGWLPGELSAQGRELAAELGARRRNDGIDAVFTSDLRRATETAEIAFAGSGIPVIEDARLRELDYGDLSGAPVADIDERRATCIETPFPAGESLRQAVDRLRDFLDEVAATWSGKRVVVIAHSAQRWGLEHLINGRPLEELIRAPFDWQEGWHYTYG